MLLPLLGLVSKDLVSMALLTPVGGCCNNSILQAI